MLLSELISGEILKSMKSKDTIKLETLRMISAALKEKLVEKKQVALTEAEEISILRSQAKKRNESANAFQAANRNDLAEIELRELEIINSFLPESLVGESLKNKILDILNNEYKDSPNVGKMIGFIMKQLKGKADGSEVKKYVEGFVNKNEL